jgi:chromosome segregation ATPase
MIEPAMYFGIGFLFATLLGVVLIPLVHSRAVRLTMRRLEASTPLSMAEIQADKDQLRAEFAMSTRRLEMSVEQMKTKTTSQLAELGKKSDAINRLKAELGDKTATIYALEAREKALKDQLRATEEEYSVKTNALHETERALTDKQSDLAKLAHDRDDKAAVADSHRVEVIALKTQIDALKMRISDYEHDIKNTENRLDRERSEIAAATGELADERGKVENLGRRIAQLEDQLLAQTAQAKTLAYRVQELETLANDQGRTLSERDRECDRLRNEIETLRRTEADLRAEVATFGDRQREATGNLKSEKTLLERELAQAQEERAKLQSELATIKRDAEATWAAERVENALLRERINDVAAEVAKLTVVLEGPNSPIEAILAGDTARHGANGDRNATSLSPDDGKGNLAERMRALQNRASRLTPTS